MNTTNVFKKQNIRNKMEEVFKSISLSKKIYNYQNIPLQHIEKMKPTFGYLVFKRHICLNSLTKPNCNCNQCYWRLYNSKIERIISSKCSKFDADCVRKYIIFSTRIKV